MINKKAINLNSLLTFFFITFLSDVKFTSSAFKEALDLRKPEVFFDGSQLAILNYAEKLTCRPGEMKKSDVDILKKSGVEDGEILEANQIICYFMNGVYCIK